MNSKKKVMDGVIWRFGERCGARIVSFCVSIILARILTPDEYGQIAIVMILVDILSIFVDSGLGNALVQKKDADELDFSTMFYSNMFICSALYIAIFCAAPLISYFYGDETLTKLIRVLGFTIIISGVKNVQQAYISKNFLFKYFFYATLSGTIISAVIGITMAVFGCGVWSLVGQHMSNMAIDTIMLWLIVKWRPQRCFSFYRLKILLSYGYKLLISSIISTLYGNLRQLIVGKLYPTYELAYYSKGKQMPSLLMDNINTSIDNVLFPVMAESQNDLSKIKEMLSYSIKLSTFILYPVLMGTIAISYPLIELILTNKWINCVPYMQIFCLVYMTFPIQTANLNAIKAIGRSDLFLKLEVMKVAVGILLLLCVMRLGVLKIAEMYFISSVFSCIFIAHENKKLFRYGIIIQIKDIFPNLILSFAMSFFVYLIYFFMQSKWAVFIQIPIGILLYIIMAILTKNKNYKIAILELKAIYLKKKK